MAQPVEELLFQIGVVKMFSIIHIIVCMHALRWVCLLASKAR